MKHCLHCLSCAIVKAQSRLYASNPSWLCTCCLWWQQLTSWWLSTFFFLGSYSFLWLEKWIIYTFLQGTTHRLGLVSDIFYILFIKKSLWWGCFFGYFTVLAILHLRRNKGRIVTEERSGQLPGYCNLDCHLVLPFMFTLANEKSYEIAGYLSVHARPSSSSIPFLHLLQELADPPWEMCKSWASFCYSVCKLVNIGRLV